MGNNPSKTQANVSASDSPRSPVTAPRQYHHHSTSSSSASHATPQQPNQSYQSHQRHVSQPAPDSDPLHPRRDPPRSRDSTPIHALSAAVSAHKATPKPSPSLESATAEPAPSPSSARDSLRSQTAAQPIPTPQSTRPADASSGSVRSRSSVTSTDKMGNSGSRPAAASQHKGSAPTAKPIDMPAAGSDSRQAQPDQQLPPLGRPPTTSADSYLLPASGYSRAPRLPLPISDEPYAPGSPVISPLDPEQVPVEPIGGDDSIRRRGSVLSSTTMDDDDDDYGDDLDTVRGGVLPPVPTTFDWREPGRQVYVTGTFADWDRKYRLRRDGPTKEKDVLSTSVPLQPGTYHLRFIVDGEMVLSKYLPTAVDFTNSLVNYIEVVPKGSPPASAPPLGSPLEAAATEPLNIKPPPGIHPPLTLPPTPELIPITDTSSVPPVSSSGRAPALTRTPKAPTPLSSGPARRYHKVIPQFFYDYEGPEDSPRYRHAHIVVSTAHPPPTLPSFLGKSVLNGVTPIKDDASVLVLPNHTVLNHLATSSIRNGVLASSATTRYKRKFLTSIMYKPTHES